jgi:acyl carrier protein
MERTEDIVRNTIVSCLALPIPPENIDENAPLFGPESAGGLSLDSLNSLEILAALSDRFQSPLDTIEGSDFVSVSTLADYIRRVTAQPQAEV